MRVGFFGVLRKLLNQNFGLILFENKIQTTSASSCRMCRILTTSVPSTTSKQCFEQPTASFLVCSLIFIEYKNTTLREKNSISESTGKRLHSGFYWTIIGWYKAFCSNKMQKVQKVRIQNTCSQKHNVAIPYIGRQIWQ